MQQSKIQKQFTKSLVGWYHEEKRVLPWRETEDPYKIWVSEVMLQQTRVETVIPYYLRFIEKFPTVYDLAEADEQEVLKMWEGLGYYSRVRNLQHGVREVAEQYGGRVPETRKEISRLKGVGPYTAGAVLSIAYGVPEHAVDGNVMRVLSRVMLIEEDIALPKTKKIFEQVVMELIDRDDPSAFNQGLMELGAIICTPRPKCLLCPVRDYCGAFNEGRQEELPVKSKKGKMTIKALHVFALRNEKGEWLMRQRPEKGLLSNMWEFPMMEAEMDRSAEQMLHKEFKSHASLTEPLLSFEHVFSHLTWKIQSYTGAFSGEAPAGFRFVSAEEAEQLPMPVPVQKIWAAANSLSAENSSKE